MIFLRHLLIVICVSFSFSLTGQNNAIIYGRISNKDNKPVSNANISVENTKIGTTSNESGEYELKIPAEEKLTIDFSYIGYKTRQVQFNAKKDSRHILNMKMEDALHSIQEISIEDIRDKSSTLIRIDPKTIYLLPTTTGGIESILKTFPGVSSNNELSSQYNVRGGNFDENLVYVNDIEVYRPLLIRSGQQEGLSFINTDMVSSIQFSAGGFDAKYGDKMSSVLDIKYRKPTKFSSTVTASMLGGSVSFEGCSKDYRFTHISGARYKTNQWVLNGLDIKGYYNPSFTDFQTYLTYDITEKFELSFLGNYARNKYNFIPVNRETSFGTINQALKLKIYFDGQEVDKFITTLGAFTGKYKVNNDFTLKFTASGFRTIEQETYDIQGQYYLNELSRDIGSNSAGDSIMNIGIGTFLNHARNYLDATVLNTGFKGNIVYNKNNISFGSNIQHEIVNNNINEWEMLDSAGYSLPYTGSVVSLFSAIVAKNNIQSNRITAYIQDSHSFNILNADFSLTAGIRFNYWDFNEEAIVSPRISIAYYPKWQSDIVFRFATGFYYQPPFYKELLDTGGNINKSIKSEKSIHYVLGFDYTFKIWQRPFKFVTEIYYKNMSDLIPYQVDNVRIIYSGKNNAKGYATGIDMKLFGEMVPGVDSWASLSLMQTKEDLNDDYYFNKDANGNSNKIEPGYIPRPGDQLLNFGLFFQDYLPLDPTYKMQLSFLYGSGLPFGPPKSPRYLATLRMPGYLRVDIGFSKILKSENQQLSERNPFHHFKNISVTFEVFNLLGANNVISYLWITDIYNNQYAVPNYLTPRTLNLKLIAKF